MLLVIKNGTTRFYGNYGKSWRHLQGWQGILREGENAAFAVFHVFDGDIPERVFVEWCGKDYSIEEIYSKGNVSIEQQGEQLVFKHGEQRGSSCLYEEKVIYGKVKIFLIVYGICSLHTP